MSTCLLTGQVHPKGTNRAKCRDCKKLAMQRQRVTPIGKATGQKHQRKVKHTALYWAKAEVYKAVRNGKLPRISSQVCVDCGVPAMVYDHRDYLKPLEVQPVCKTHNLIRGPGLNWNVVRAPSVINTL